MTDNNYINNFIDNIFNNDHNKKKIYLELLSKYLTNNEQTSYVYYDNVWMPYEEYLKIISTIKNPKSIDKELLEKTFEDYMYKIDISKLSIENKYKKIEKKYKKIEKK